MLADIAAVLGDLGIEIGDINNLSVNVRHSHHVSYFINAGSGRFYFTKLAPIHKDDALVNEAKALEHVQGHLPGSTPSALGLVQHNGISFLVLSSIASEPIHTHKDICGSARRIESTASTFNGIRQASSAEGLVDLATHNDFFKQNAPKLIEYLSTPSITEISSRLPRILQHGDFTVNNLGLRRHRPVIYDWEDYAAVDLPGFDVAMFIGSFFDHNPERLQDVLHGNSTMSAATRRFVDVSGLSYEDFLSMIPIYYGYFYWLKRNKGYKGKIQRLALSVISAFLKDQ